MRRQVSNPMPFWEVMQDLYVLAEWNSDADLVRADTSETVSDANDRPLASIDRAIQVSFCCHPFTSDC